MGNEGETSRGRGGEKIWVIRERYQEGEEGGEDLLRIYVEADKGGFQKGFANIGCSPRLAGLITYLEMCTNPPPAVHYDYCYVHIHPVACLVSPINSPSPVSVYPCHCLCFCPRIYSCFRFCFRSCFCWPAESASSIECR